MIEVVRLQMNGERTTGNYPPRFEVGDVIVCLNNDGISMRLERGELYKVGHEGQERYTRNSGSNGMWTNSTKIYISYLNGTPVNGVVALNYRFDLVEISGEPSCIFCNSNCKKEEPCGFFDSIIKEVNVQ